MQYEYMYAGDMLYRYNASQALRWWYNIAPRRCSLEVLSMVSILATPHLLPLAY